MLKTNPKLLVNKPLNVFPKAVRRLTDWCWQQTQNINLKRLLKCCIEVVMYSDLQSKSYLPGMWFVGAYTCLILSDNSVQESISCFETCKVSTTIWDPISGRLWVAHLRTPLRAFFSSSCFVVQDCQNTSMDIPTSAQISSTAAGPRPQGHAPASGRFHQWQLSDDHFLVLCASSRLDLWQNFEKWKSIILSRKTSNLHHYSHNPLGWLNYLPLQIEERESYKPKYN